MLAASLISLPRSISVFASSKRRWAASKLATSFSRRVFSFSSPCALTLSFQKSGSVESRSISAMRLFLRSTSKRPPKPVQAGLEIVHLFNELIIRHGGRSVMRALRLTQASFRC